MKILISVLILSFFSCSISPTPTNGVSNKNIVTDRFSLGVDGKIYLVCIDSVSYVIFDGFKAGNITPQVDQLGQIVTCKQSNTIIEESETHGKRRN